MSDDMLPPRDDRDDHDDVDEVLEDELRALFTPVAAPHDFRARLKAELLGDDERFVLLASEPSAARRLWPVAFIAAHPRAALTTSLLAAAAALLLALALNSGTFGVTARRSTLPPVVPPTLTATQRAAAVPPIGAQGAGRKAKGKRRRAPVIILPPPTTTHTPRPAATHTPPPPPTATATHTPRPTATYTYMPTPTPTPRPTATHVPPPTSTATPPPPPTATITVPPSMTPVPSATALPSATAVPSPTVSPIPPSPTAQAKGAGRKAKDLGATQPPIVAPPSPTARATRTPVPTATVVPPTATIRPRTPTATVTAIPRPTRTATATATATATVTPRPTQTATVTPRPTHTATAAPRPTHTATATAIATPTPRPSPTALRPSPTATVGATATPAFNNVVNPANEKPNARAGLPAPNELNGILDSPLQGAWEASATAGMSYTVPISWMPPQPFANLPVYPIAHTPISATAVLAVARQLGARKPFGTTPRPDGSVVARVLLDSVPYTLTVSSGYGAPWFRLQAVQPAPGNLSSVRLAAQATAWLQEHNLLHPDLHPLPSQDGTLQYAQTFSDTPLLGQSSALSVSFDGRGILSDVIDHYIVPSAPIAWPAQPSVIAADDALLGGQGLYQGPISPTATVTGPAAVSSMAIAYAGVHGAGPNDDYLEPVYVLGGMVPTTTGPQPFDVYISALKPPDTATSQP